MRCTLPQRPPLLSLSPQRCRAAARVLHSSLAQLAACADYEQDLTAPPHKLDHAVAGTHAGGPGHSWHGAVAGRGAPGGRNTLPQGYRRRLSRAAAGPAHAPPDWPECFGGAVTSCSGAGSCCRPGGRPPLAGGSPRSCTRRERAHGLPPSDRRKRVCAFVKLHMAQQAPEKSLALHGWHVWLHAGSCISFRSIHACDPQLRGSLFTLGVRRLRMVQGRVGLGGISLGGGMKTGLVATPMGVGAGACMQS